MASSYLRRLPLAFAFCSYVTTVYGHSLESRSSAEYGTLSSPVDLGAAGHFNGSMYTTEIILGGQNFTVIIDTGSTDLWVDARGLNLKTTNNTGIDVEFSYAIGSVEGDIQFADLQIGPYVIPNQVFISAAKVDAFPGNIKGLIGMAFDTATIFQTLSETWGLESTQKLGRAPITNLFTQNPSAPAYFDLELGRLDASGVEQGGHLLFGQHAKGMEAINKAPQLQRIQPDHWTVVMDGMSINGKPFTGWNKSAVPDVPEGKVATVFDSGFTYTQLPDAVVAAIYSSIPGAVPYNGPIPGTDNGGNVTSWIVPCNASTNLSFILGGQEYPVHPRDIITMYNGVKLGTIDGIDLVADTTICLNSFQVGKPIDAYDVLLGMPFLRNVYASFHYGDYTPPGNVTTGEKPYLQFLSVTDPKQAWPEFNDYVAVQLAKSAPPADPASFVEVLNAYTGQSQTSASSGSSSAGADAAGDLAVSGAASDSSTDGSNKSGDFGPLAAGLSAASVVIGLMGLSVSLFMCIRGVKGRRDASYKPLHRLPKEDAAGVDSERGTLYSD
ncbi:aspartic peptidase domain-containing protein [Cubamyces lactineus]|nr:aspartic peptidase domain-containing protein [Cubamyces lactineus]